MRPHEEESMLRAAREYANVPLRPLTMNEGGMFWKHRGVEVVRKPERFHVEISVGHDPACAREGAWTTFEVEGRP